MKHLPWAGLVLAVAFGVGGWFGVPRIKRHQCVEQLVAYRQSAGTTPPGLQPMILFEAKHACG